MTHYVDSQEFEEFDRSPMTPCTPPSLVDFQTEGTLIWANIGGEMRVYSNDNGTLKYQVVQLGAPINA